MIGRWIRPCPYSTLIRIRRNPMPRTTSVLHLNQVHPARARSLSAVYKTHPHNGWVFLFRHSSNGTGNITSTFKICGFSRKTSYFQASRKIMRVFCFSDLLHNIAVRYLKGPFSTALRSNHICSAVPCEAC